MSTRVLSWVGASRSRQPTEGPTAGCRDDTAQHGHDRRSAAGGLPRTPRLSNRFSPMASQRRYEWSGSRQRRRQLARQKWERQQRAARREHARSRSRVEHRRGRRSSGSSSSRWSCWLVAADRRRRRTTATPPTPDRRRRPTASRPRAATPADTGYHRRTRRPDAPPTSATTPSEHRGTDDREHRVRPRRRRRHRLRRAPQTASASSASGPTATPQAALDFYRKRYDGLAVEVDLLEQRIKCGRAVARGRRSRRSPRCATVVDEAQAVGDLDALDGPPRRPAAADRRAPRGAQGRTRREGRRVARQAKEQIADEAETLAHGQRLAQRRQPAARAARRVEGPAPHRQADRRRAVAPVLVGPDDVHPPAQAALRRAQREARRRPGRQGEARRRGRGARRRRPTGARPHAPTAT